jgi:2-keto-4-pentenoate hydratase/2-oxohepta-3-ene-1,7-dioic acid hydratase in catechol pathway
MQPNIYGYTHRPSSLLDAASLKSSPQIFAVAKNFYSDQELSQTGKIIEAPIIFMKSYNSLVDFREPINLQGSQDIHYELEIALLIGQIIHLNSEASAIDAVVGLAACLDLTKKDVQNKLKEKQGSWEAAKAFDRSCPITEFFPVFSGWQNESRIIELEINGEVRQMQSTEEMIHNFSSILMEISKHFTLLPGDVVLTGTPVKPHPTRPLKKGDKLVAKIETLGIFKTTVI